MAMENGDSELEKKLWESANKLRGPVRSSEYRDIVLGLLFLKYMSDSFDERQDELEELTHDEDSEYYTESKEEREHILETKAEYYKENVFYVPEESRWDYLVKNAPQPDIGKKIDDAMRGIMEENPEELKNMLPVKYAKSNIPQDSLEELLNIFADLKFNSDEEHDYDLLGRVYEYFIKKFAKEEGDKGGEFYTPKSVVELMVEVLEPYEGRLFDPFCGSGGMFIQSHNFLKEHGKDDSNISIYGQEIKTDTWKICKMNLALRGMDGNIKVGDSIREDQHQNLKADYIIANPPFNESEWGKDQLSDDDPRFPYGHSTEYANYDFIQHMVYHLAEDGQMATVMAKGAMSNESNEDIREQMVEDDLFDIVIDLPKKMFYTTQIPACIFIMCKDKEKDEYRDRKDETLFIDARNLYDKIDRRLNELNQNHIEKIVEKVRQYRGLTDEEYEDVEGFCKVVDKSKITENRNIITPGRYVGFRNEEKGIGEISDELNNLERELEDLFMESENLENKIIENFQRLDYE